jgi:hypothetical protein
VKVFLDTNVLVSAFISRGLCADLLKTVLGARCIPHHRVHLSLVGHASGVPGGWAASNLPRSPVREWLLTTCT